MKEKKDEKLNHLFKSYIQEEEAPPECVTNKAIELMRNQPQTEEVIVPVPAAATGGGNVAGRRLNNPARYAIAVSALALLLCAVLLLCFLLPARGPFLDMTSQSLNETQYAAVAKQFEENEYFPFIDSRTVSEYKEYVLTEEIEYYYEGDTVGYYVKYRTENNVNIELFLELDGISFETLNSFRELTDTTEITDVTVYSDTEGSVTNIFFVYTTNAYNLIADTTDQELINNILYDMIENL